MISVLPPDAEASGAGTPLAEATSTQQRHGQAAKDPVILERRDKHGTGSFFMVHCESNRPLAQSIWSPIATELIAIHLSGLPYLHSWVSQGTPSLSPSILVPGQFFKKYVASAQEVICEQCCRPSQA